MLYFNEENILNEVYFGKTKDIQELQDIFSKYRNQILEDDTFFKKHGNTSEYLFQFNRKIEEIFGFGAYSLSIIYDPSINAFTMPISTSFDVWNEKKHLKPNKNTFKYDKQSDYACCTFIFSGLFCDTKYTNEEMLAIILHEIGHNFQNALNPKSFIFATLLKTTGIIAIIILLIKTLNPVLGIKLLFNTNSFKKFDAKVTEMLTQKFKVITSTANFLSNLKSEIQFIQKGLSLAAAPLIVYINSIIISLRAYNPMSLILMYFKYNDEKIADDFVATYGYGPELSSALVKLSYKRPTPKNSINKLVYAIRDTLFLPATIISTPADEHPTTINRSLEIINYLQDELNNNIKDPKMRKKIKKEIDKVKNELNELLDSKYNLKDENLIKAYEVYMHKKFGIGLKEKLFKTDNSKIMNKSYQTALNKIKLL